VRQDVAFVMSEHPYSEREACKLLSIDRTTYRYQPRADHNAELREKLIALARQKPQYGYRRLAALLERDGAKASPQRVYRVYSAERLAVRRLKRKRLVRPAAESTLLTRVNQELAIDFVADGIATGRGLRMLTVVDSFTRECPVIEVDTSLCSRRVTRVLDRVIEERGKPETIRCDNELNASAFFEKERTGHVDRAGERSVADRAARNVAFPVGFHVYLVLLCYKATILCRIVLWAKRLCQAHRNCALRHISRAWPKPQGMPIVTLR
jgi:transposase InsO family protein